MEEDIKQDQFLDVNISVYFRDIINSSPIFEHEYREYYNLICVVMDRVDTCVNYLNNHAKYPKSEEDFLAFTMFACMLVDAVKEILLQLEIIQDRDKLCAQGDEYKYFKEICMDEPLNLDENQCPTDDRFFEYFRSLAFAHPFKTNRPKFFEKGEIQYSPWVLANLEISTMVGVKGGVGVRIYSNMREDIMDLRIPLETLKDYICSRYILLSQATVWAQERIEDIQSEWRTQQVNRNQEPISILHDALEIVYSRHWESDYLERAISYLTCQLTYSENQEVVEQYRAEIINRVPELCNAIEALDEECACEILDSILRVRPQHLHQGASYQLEKIFSYLNEEHPSNITRGLIQAQAFYDEFAKKWVKIVPNEMSFTEIKLLVRTACYMEAKEQKSVR